MQFGLIWTVRIRVMGKIVSKSANFSIFSFIKYFTKKTLQCQSQSHEYMLNSFILTH